MSIAGIIAFNRDLLSSSLSERFKHSLSHRCFSSTLYDPKQGLLLLGNHQQEGSTNSVFDGCLTNRNYLKNELACDGDDHTLAHLSFQRWGKDFADYLRGSFVYIAIEDDHILLARDPFGHEPLYYAFVANQFFAFASEAHALLNLPQISDQLDAIAIGQFITRGFVEKGSTLFADIKRLKPASTLSVRRHQLDEERYWTPSIRALETEDYHLLLERELIASTEAYLSNSSKPGMALSAGLDSTSIACAAHHLDKHPIAFHLAINEKNASEISDVRQFATRLDLELIEIPTDDLNVFHQSDTLIHRDAPSAEPNSFLLLALMERAAAHGVDRLFSGIDGDSIVSGGWGLYRELFASGKWNVLIKEIRQEDKRLRSRILKSLARDIVSFPFYHLLENSSYSAQKAIPRFLKNSFTQEIDLVNTLKKKRDSLSKDSHQLTHQNRLNSHAFSSTLEQLDRHAAAHQLKLAFPFFNRDLAEICLSAPTAAKRAGGYTRPILRQTFEKSRGKALSWKKNKADFTSYIYRQIKTSQKELAQAMLEASEIFEKILDKQILLAQIKVFESGKATPAEISALWRLAGLNLWIKKWSYQGEIR